MNMRIADARLEAAVRSGVLCTLMEAFPALFPAEYASLTPPRSSLRLSLSGGRVKRRLFMGDRGISEKPGSGLFLPALRLDFLSEKSLASRLSGGPGTVLPLPGGPGFIRAAGLFSTLSSRISALMAAKHKDGSADWQLQTKMLLHAALRGVSEVAQADQWTAAKSAKLPLGALEVLVGDPSNPDFRGFLFREKVGKVITTRYIQTISAVPRARLHFLSMETAGAILRGSANAMEALGLGHIRISGKLPYIQGIFPLLDRFSEIMAGVPGSNRGNKT